MTSASFARMANVTAATKRSPAPVGGVIGAPTAHLSDLKVLPPMPAGQQIIERYRLESPRRPLVTYLAGAADIVQGDRLVIGAADYPIVGVGPWPSDLAFLEILIDDVVGD
jgi:hypothetical protein